MEVRLSMCPVGFMDRAVVIGRAVWLLDPACVFPRRVSGQLVYQVSIPGQGSVNLSPADILCIHGLGYDGIMGYSIAALGRQSIGQALALQRFRAAFYANGTQASIALQHPGTLSPSAFENLRKSFASRHSGANNAWKPLILEEGIQVKELSFDAQKSQVQETASWNVSEIARWFRISPMKIGDHSHATYSNFEQSAISHVVDCLTPWAERLEQEAESKLLSPTEDLEIEHDFSELLRGDNAARADYHAKLVAGGIESRNEARAAEGLPPITDGDEVFCPVNTQPLSKMMNPTPAPVASSPVPLASLNPTKDPTKEPAGQDNQAGDTQQAARAILEKELERLRHTAIDKKRRGKYDAVEHRAVTASSIGPICQLGGLDADAELDDYMRSIADAGK
jgi:HK97 family phage portal protein